MKRALPYVLLGAAAAIYPYAVARVFLDTPIERQMGTAFKIFFFHVPMGWLCMLMALICGVAAAIELRKRSQTAAAVALAAAELGFVCGLGVLLTGPIWGNATWGKPWTGDARQVSTALLWLVIAAYLVVRHYGPSSNRRLAAALAIFGAIDVPVIYQAVKWWKTQHPTTEVVGSLPPALWASLWPALGALALTVFGLLAIRVRQLLLADALDEGWARQSDLAAAKEDRHE